MIVSFEENGRIYQYGDTNKVKTSTDKISSLSQEMMFADRPQSYLFTIVLLLLPTSRIDKCLIEIIAVSSCSYFFSFSFGCVDMQSYYC